METKRVNTTCSFLCFLSSSSLSSGLPQSFLRQKMGTGRRWWGPPVGSGAGTSTTALSWVDLDSCVLFFVFHSAKSMFLALSDYNSPSSWLENKTNVLHTGN